MKVSKLLEKYVSYILVTFGLLFIISGVFFIANFPSIHDHIIKTILTFAPGTKAYEAWRTNEPPLILDFYFFNWTNPTEVKNSAVKPNFEEVGPYRFGEVKEKHNISLHDNNTVSYEFVKRYYYLEDDSPRKLTDVINSINPVALTAAYKARFYTPFMKSVFSMSLSGTSKIHVTKSIGELMFEGYKDKLLDLVRPLSPFIQAGKISDKFGWFYERNDTYGISGTFSMYMENDENFGKLLSWNDKNYTDFYEGQCSEIRGSAGEFHPMNRKKDFIEIYSSEMCTYAVLDYEKEVEVKGVKAYKYSSDSLFDNGTRNRENVCYCNGECLPSGVLNISSCRMNAPIFLSLPHFYNADPYFTQIIDGMSPNKSLHDFYVSLEPKSAIVVEIGARMQLNVLLQPIPGISLYQRVPKVLVPVFYFDQVLPMTDDLAFYMNILQNLPEMSNFFCYILMFIGMCLAIFAIYLAIAARCKKKDDTLKKNEISLPQLTLTPEEIPARIKNDH